MIGRNLRSGCMSTISTTQQTATSCDIRCSSTMPLSLVIPNTNAELRANSVTFTQLTYPCARLYLLLFASAATLAPSLGQFCGLQALSCGGQPSAESVTEQPAAVGAHTLRTCTCTLIWHQAFRAAEMSDAVIPWRYIHCSRRPRCMS